MLVKVEDLPRITAMSPDGGILDMELASAFKTLEGECIFVGQMTDTIVVCRGTVLLCERRSEDTMHVVMDGTIVGFTG